jgi:hypothetical protein
MNSHGVVVASSFGCASFFNRKRAQRLKCVPRPCLSAGQCQALLDRTRACRALLKRHVPYQSVCSCASWSGIAMPRSLKFVPGRSGTLCPSSAVGGVRQQVASSLDPSAQPIREKRAAATVSLSLLRMALSSSPRAIGAVLTAQPGATLAARSAIALGTARAMAAASATGAAGGWARKRS